jgi:hypothetical protein
VKYAVEMGSDAMRYVSPSTQAGFTPSKIHKQHGHTSTFIFLSIQVSQKLVRIITESSANITGNMKQTDSDWLRAG